MSKKGRNKKQPKEDEKSILKSAEAEMNKLYTTTINLEEKNSIIPYNIYQKTKSSNQLNDQINKMLKIYLNKKMSNNNNNNIRKTIKKVVSFFNMNENEFALFTLLLELIKFDNQEQLYYIGILCMQISSDYYQNNNDEQYNKWFENINNKYNNQIQLIDIKDINDRYEELLITNDENNQKEQIDYNKVVDKIIHMYRPYNQN